MSKLFRALLSESDASETPLMSTGSNEDPLAIESAVDDDAVAVETFESVIPPNKLIERSSSNTSLQSSIQPEIDYSTLYGGIFQNVDLPVKGTLEREEMEQKFKSKIDYAILPVVIAMYMMNYLDRNNIAAARLSTLVEDLSLTGTQYSNCLSILYVGYILMQLPSNLILEKVGHPSIYLPAAMVIWGVLSTCIAFVRGYNGLVFNRFLIGFAEAAFYPGTIFYLSCWYTKYEIAKRSALFICGSWVSGAFSGFVAYGVLENLDGVYGLAAWRWLFLLEGLLTIAVALIAMWILPNLPATTTWLSKEERLLGVLRMIEDAGQQDEDVAGFSTLDVGRSQSKMRSAFSGVMMALRDSKLYIVWPMVFSLAVTGGINSVFPTIVDSLGFGRPKTLLLTAPPWLLCAVTSVMNGIHSDRTGERYLHMLWGPALSLLGLAICILSTNTALRYVAMLLLLQIYNSWPLAFAWMASIFARPPIKRAAAVGIVNIGGNLPNIFVPYLFYQGSGPQFYLGFIVCGLFAVFGMVGATILRNVLRNLNKKLAKGAKVDGVDGSTGFRFVY
ncbi:major facilitator superfamily domain-containing protein [Lipomyces arxii]|uniref:major facilitator superfamily domain-containing protein n=1 Tax=Lipomyces arxii TaxID=56418 RepID=UPI0034CDC50E